MAGQLSLKYAGAALLFAACAGISLPALAGFQWVAPGENASAPPMSEPSISSSSSSYQPTPSMVAPEVISPVVISGNPEAQPTPLPPIQMPHQPSPSQMPRELPEMHDAQDVVAGAATHPDQSVVTGFAKSVPLAVALRQILPSGYAFSIDQDVDMGTLVSFKGGRGWRETLHDALSPAGLSTREQGQMVEVGYARNFLSVPAKKPMANSLPSNTLPPKPFMNPPEAKYLALPQAPAAGLVSGMSMSPTAEPLMQVNDAWSAERGEHLHKVLQRWASRAKVEFNWLSEYDYPLQASVSFNGNFESAVRNLLIGFQDARPQPIAELHTNPGMGQTVLIVQSRGNTNSD